MVTRQDVIHYRDQLSATGLRAATVGVRLAALHSLFEAAKYGGLVERNPVEGVNRPKVEAYAGAKWLTSGEAAQVLRCVDRDTLDGKRDYAILIVMLTMGLRRTEAASLRHSMIVERGDGATELRYTPKGGEDRTRPIPSAAAHAIRDYLAARGDVQADAPVFVAHDNANDSRGEAKPLSGEAIRLLVARYSLKALGRIVNPHALRHTCAGAAWDSTKDLRRVQSLLGHASATTTEKYLHRRDDDRGALGDALAVMFGAR